MAIYRSKYTSNAFENLFDLYTNNKLINEALYINYNIETNNINTIDTNNLNLDDSIILKVDGNTKLFLHTFTTNIGTFKFITHYPNKYESLYYAVTDFGDQVYRSFNNNKILTVDYTSTQANCRYIKDGTILSRPVNVSSVFSNYTIERIEVI